MFLLTLEFSLGRSSSSHINSHAAANTTIDDNKWRHQADSLSQLSTAINARVKSPDKDSERDEFAARKKEMFLLLHRDARASER